MKLKIETNGAKRASYGATVKQLKLEDNVVILPFHIQNQELSNWCWAAITSSISDYYQLGLVSQREIAQRVLGSKNDQIANEEATLDKALSCIGCFSHWSLGKPSFERICFEINQKKPVAVLVEWKTGGSHYLVISGYDTSSLSIHIKDPHYGKSVVKYAHFPNKYIKEGIWTDTFWIKSPSIK